MDDDTKQIIMQSFTALIRHGLTIAAGSLVTLGWLAPAQSGAFTEILSGIAVGAIGYGWSVLNKKNLVTSK